MYCINKTRTKDWDGLKLTKKLSVMHSKFPKQNLTLDYLVFLCFQKVKQKHDLDSVYSVYMLDLFVNVSRHLLPAT